LVDAARQRKLEVVGWVDGKVDSGSAIAAAKAAGLSAVAIQGFTGKSEFPVLPWGDRAHAPWDTTAPVMPITENVWPGVQGRSNSANAGPTALPWLDSNGWYIQLAKARTKTPVWVMFDPPGKGEVVPSAGYALAVCDAEKAGGRWVISLDDSVRAGLISKDANALAAWKAVADAVGFFAKHSEWKSWLSTGFVGVISDFKGENYDFSGEILNLASRRDLLTRVLWNLGKAPLNFAGLKAATWADSAKPTPAVRRALLNFVQTGGLLITGPKWGTEGVSKPGAHPDFDIRTLGKGRIAISKEELADPWSFVMSVQELLSHANDVAKLFNASASGGFGYAASPDGKRALLQLLSYSSGRGRAGYTNNATAWTRHKYRKALFWTLDSAQATEIKPVASEDGGTEYPLPPMPSYTALEFEV
jgi:hypothetical protein